MSLKSQLIINNKSRDAQGGKTFERRNALTNEVASTGAAGTVKDALQAVESAAEAFKTWSKTGPTQRRAVLLKAADLIEQRAGDFIGSMMAEVGAVQLWAGFNVFLTAQLFREAAGLATQIQGETIPTDKPGAFSFTFRTPAGVVFSMAPWNGTGVLAARAIAYPLVCGNTVVFRASEFSPMTHQIISEVLIEAGLPEGVLNFISTTPEDADSVVEAIVAHPMVRRINFTGSTNVGRIIAQKAAKHLKPVLLELGGKAPQVVLDDADIDGAVNAAVFGAFMYQGQICMSTERFVVDESIADEFVKKFAERARTLPAGDPMTDPNVIVGPMIRPESGDRINKMITDALAKGAEVIAGGPALGAAMPATIVDKVKPGMDIYDLETFGPITTIVRVKGVDEAIRVANDTDYGLAAAVFGKDSTRALQVALQIDAGHVHVNGATVQNEAQAPYGGMKSSGYGRFDGRGVINEFTDLKWITVEPSDQPYPF
ncbi:acyl-CoA reductase-like NAD-dependent aldehyde dehydrogenase [Aurantimicrobium minutum]|uniref:aldehyde dehydrogenase n=1 Tax=Aurantimicrobium minutum TaxID=708131 RepID=UPI002474CDB5|nr:aldehyde dehydrogenase [Aurantimicrobium minutum]MDH6532817.1 acyl-CoA reductase-like NAD-dependent aldehyde dehydrogenase [Aurantimicrobium minutum]